MTAILGQTSCGVTFLGTDTRRRNHVTGEMTIRRKLHSWSDQLLIAQGGAGKGAADKALAALCAEREAIGLTAIGVEQAIQDISPSIMASARQEWDSKKRDMPATRLVLASVCPQTNAGFIRAIDLETGKRVHESRAPQPYFSGSNFEAVSGAVSQTVYELRGPGMGEFNFDVLAVHTIGRLSISHARDIHLPADVGYVRYDAKTGQWRSKIVKDLGLPITPRGEFRTIG